MEELTSDQISRFSSSDQRAGSYGDRQEFGVENETGKVTCDEIELKHVQNKRYQKHRVRVSRPIRLLLRLVLKILGPFYYCRTLSNPSRCKKSG